MMVIQKMCCMILFFEKMMFPHDFTDTIRYDKRCSIPV